MKAVDNLTADGQFNYDGSCVDDCTNGTSNGGNGSSSNSSSQSGKKKGGATALKVGGEDAMKLVGWFLGLLVVGYMF